MPKYSKTETFLSFFIKYACYLYHFSVSYFLEDLIKKNATPIFVEYKGESILLSSYNELVVFNEICKTLNQTLENPQNFFKTIYTTATWSILSCISLNLLSLPNEENQRDFKVEIIQELYSICIKALKTNKAASQESSSFENTTRTICAFMENLTKIEMLTRAKKDRFITHKTQIKLQNIQEPNQSLIYKVLKNHSFFDMSPSLKCEKIFCEFGEKLSDFDKEEIQLMKNYSFKFESIDPNILRGKFYISIIIK